MRTTGTRHHARLSHPEPLLSPRLGTRKRQPRRGNCTNLTRPVQKSLPREQTAPWRRDACWDGLPTVGHSARCVHLVNTIACFSIGGVHRKERQPGASWAAWASHLTSLGPSVSIHRVLWAPWADSEQQKPSLTAPATVQRGHCVIGLAAALEA